MVFWSNLKTKLKAIVSKSDFDKLKASVDQNTKDIKTNSNVINSINTSLNDKASLSIDNQFHNTNYFNGSTHLTNANADNIAISKGVITSSPSTDNDITNKKYVDDKFKVKQLVFTESFKRSSNATYLINLSTPEGTPFLDGIYSLRIEYISSKNVGDIPNPSQAYYPGTYLSPQVGNYKNYSIGLRKQVDADNSFFYELWFAYDWPADYGDDLSIKVYVSYI